MAILDEFILKLADLVYHPYKTLYGDLKGAYSDDALRISLSRALEDGYIKKRLSNDEVFLSLTEFGRRRLIQSLPLDSASHKNYCVVIFDIPERDRLLRALLRSKLREAKFIGWQKSVWIGKNIDLRKLRVFLRQARLEEYVFAFETKDPGNAKLVKLLG